MEVVEKVGKIAEIVKRHDEHTFPEIMATLVRMESKQNKDIEQFNKKSSEIEERIKPLEIDYHLRKTQQDEFKSEIRKIRWGIVSAIVLGAVVGLFDHIINIFKNIIRIL